MDFGQFMNHLSVASSMALKHHVQGWRHFFFLVFLASSVGDPVSTNLKLFFSMFSFGNIFCDNYPFHIKPVHFF